MKNALIVGFDGSLSWELTDFLIGKGYKVHGLISESNNVTLETEKNLVIHYGNLTDGVCLGRLIKEIKPIEIYNLESNGISTGKLLEVIRILDLQCKIYQHSTGEIFGEGDDSGKTEESQLEPTTQSAISKLYGHLIAKSYRKNYGMYVCNGIVFDHESVRTEEVSTIKAITKGISEVISHRREKIIVSDLDIKRDLGFTTDYVEAIWLTLQQGSGDDYIIATNENHSLREFIQKAFKVVGIKIEWKKIDGKEVGCDSSTSKVLIEVGNSCTYTDYNRVLKGNPAKAESKLGWNRKTSFEELVNKLIGNDLKKVSKMTIEEVLFKQEISRKIKGM